MHAQLPLDGSCVLVTGAARRLGAAISRRMHAAGATDREITESRAEHLKDSPLASLAEQLGSRQSQPSAHKHHDGLPLDGPYPALRTSVKLPATAAWKRDRSFEKPHRRAEDEPARDINPGLARQKED